MTQAVRKARTRLRRIAPWAVAVLVVLGFALGFGQHASAAASLVHDTGSGLDVDEDTSSSHHSDTYKLKLGSAPSASVTITITWAPLDQITVSPTTLTFTTANWNNNRTVTVTAVDDAIQEGDHHATLTETCSSTDPTYDGFVAYEEVDIEDNDEVLEFSASSGHINVTEGGATDTYQVRLKGNPGEDHTVTVNLTTPDGQVSVSPTPLTFSHDNYHDWQTVTVTAVDDHVVEASPHPGVIVHTTSSDKSSMNGRIAYLTANVTDNDVAGVTVSESSVDVTEGGATDTYTVVLTSEPTDDVVVSLSTAHSYVTLSASSLTFTAANWDDPQTVTVTAVDDHWAEGSHSDTISHTAASDEDENYDGIAVSSVTADITDNDVAGVTVSESSVDVTEGGATDTYTIVLTSQPTAGVTIAIAPDHGFVTVDPTSVTFPGLAGGAPLGVLTIAPAEWDVPRTVTVTAFDDDWAEGNHSDTIGHTATSDDSNYDEISISDVIANITDNDTAGVTISKTSVDVTEGGADDTYTIVLNSQPTAEVTIGIAPDHGFVTVDPTSMTFSGLAGGAEVGALTFTPADWNDPQTVTVEAVDDDWAEGPHSDTIGHTATSEDGNYDEVSISDVTANITDNDTAGVTISRESVSVTEGGTTDTYTIVLNSQPTAGVTIGIAPDNGFVTVDPTSVSFPGLAGGAGVEALTITPDDWDVPRTVTVTAVDDSIAEGTHYDTIFHTASSEDGDYDDISISHVDATITDNDTAGVVIRPLTVDVTEGGATDTYQVVLTSEPTGQVTITMSPDSQVTVFPAVLYFGPGVSVETAQIVEPGAWGVPQTVTVTAVDDTAVEGDHIGIIHHSASGGGYSGIEIDDVIANITDNDRLPPPPPQEEESCCNPPTIHGPLAWFTDLSNHWAASDCGLAATLGILGGPFGGQFHPDQTITRAEFVVALERTMGHGPSAASMPFSDVAPTDPFYADLLKAVDGGFAVGYADGTFRPDQVITRAEAGVMLAGALVHHGVTPVSSDYVAKMILSAFSDADEVSGAGLKPMALTVYKEVMEGRSAGVLAPNAGLSRAEAATSLMRLWRFVALP